MQESADRQFDRIRVALVITELEVGGAERCLVNLANGLDRERFEPEVYSLAPRPSAGRDQLVEELEAATVPVHFIGVRSGRQFLKAVRRLRRRLANQSPHVLQSFLFHANVVGALAGRLAGVPAIVTGVRVAEPNRWRQRVERFFTRRASRIVCVSNSVSDYCRDTARFARDKLVVIPNGIDVRQTTTTDAADLVQFGIPAGRPVFVCVGRLVEQKGLDWLLTGTSKLFAAVPDAHLLLVGDGKQRGELEEKCRLHRIDDRVHFAGWREDVAEILQSCQALLLPSRWEGMPNVLIEAMAAGLPVVATRVEGVDQILGPLAEQQTVQPNDIAGFVRAISQIANNPDLAIRLGRENRQRIVECFSLGGMIAAYEQLFESACRE